MHIKPIEWDPIVPLPFVSENTRVNRIIRYIFFKWNYVIELRDVADVAKVTPEYTSFLFNKTVGLSIPNYVNSFRINKAGYMLRNSSLKVEEIAQKCGFQTPSYFIKLFGELSGLSPGEYRKREISAITQKTCCIQQALTQSELLKK